MQKYSFDQSTGFPETIISGSGQPQHQRDWSQSGGLTAVFIHPSSANRKHDIPCASMDRGHASSLLHGHGSHAGTWGFLIWCPQYDRLQVADALHSYKTLFCRFYQEDRCLSEGPRATQPSPDSPRWLSRCISILNKVVFSSSREV